MAVKIRLKRLGKVRAPFYRIVVADSRTKRNGRVIEEIGKYHPTEHPSLIEVDSERAQYWLGVGAQPSESVVALLKLTGDWGTFTGEGSTENQVQAPEGRTAFVADENKKPVLKPKADIAEPAPVAAEPAAAEEAPAAEAEGADEAAADASAEEKA
ncbi:MAG: 30S ribosomal protein S16 [Pseudoclavibacter sp.]